MIVREIKTSDAEKFIHLTQQVEGSSEDMLWEAGERNIPRTTTNDDREYCSKQL